MDFYDHRTLAVHPNNGRLYEQLVITGDFNNFYDSLFLYFVSTGILPARCGTSRLAGSKTMR